MRKNSLQTDYDLRNSHTDLALPKQRREFLKKGLSTVMLNFGIAFRSKQRKRNQFTLSKFCKTIILMIKSIIDLHTRPGHTNII